MLLKAGEHRHSAYEYDVVNIGRQVLGNYFGNFAMNLRSLFPEAITAIKNKKGAEMKTTTA